ncbi:ATP-dependent Clp protease adapter ClpS [Trueperella sp. LYQ143]|uniref:ATP-dependent Clp protease adapter ClpS n=1 Tax=unclassified Trueperella TaxID=2630174 RepID=UPI0039838D09
MQTSPEAFSTSHPQQEHLLAGQWRTVVHNDVVNLVNYVQWVFQTYFSMSPEAAFRKTMEVHHAGRAVVSNGQREQMERDAQAMHAYGLWATIEPGK